MLFLDIVLSPLAEDDFSDILLYTWQRWGERQRDVYAEKLDSALKNLSHFPHLGIGRDDLFSGCRVFTMEKHSFFYRITKNQTIEIVRILSTRMDPKHHDFSVE